MKEEKSKLNNMQNKSKIWIGIYQGYKMLSTLALPTFKWDRTTTTWQQRNG